MALAVWLEDLPLPKLSNYSVRFDSAILRTAMEGGNPRQRRVFTQVPLRFNAVFIFTNIEYAFFRGFFKIDLNEGVDFFLIELDMDVGLTEESARFLGLYKAKKISNASWSVEGILEVTDPPINSETFVFEQIAFLLSQLEVLMVELTNL